MLSGKGLKSNTEQNKTETVLSYTSLMMRVLLFAAQVPKDSVFKNCECLEHMILSKRWKEGRITASGEEKKPHYFKAFWESTSAGWVTANQEKGSMNLDTSSDLAAGWTRGGPGCVYHYTDVPFLAGVAFRELWLLAGPWSRGPLRCKED